MRQPNIDSRFTISLPLNTLSMHPIKKAPKIQRALCSRMIPCVAFGNITWFSDGCCVALRSLRNHMRELCDHGYWARVANCCVYG